MLTISQNNNIALFKGSRRDGDGGNTHHVDPHIVDIGRFIVAMGGHQPGGGKDFPDLNGLIVPAHNIEVYPVMFLYYLCLLPTYVVVTCGRPARYFRLFVGVISFALEEAAEAYRSIFVNLPGVVVAHHQLFAPIIVGYDQFGKQGLKIPKKIEVGRGKCHITRVPARVEYRSHGVGAIFQHSRNVIGVIAQCLPKLAVAGRKPVVANPFAVYIHLVRTH